jgi:hypothetical protein
MKIKEVITEDTKLKSHIAHPEDMVFTNGIPGANQAVDELSKMATGKELTTIKWDGFPALVFGRNVDGKLSITDKHMFDKKDGSGRVTSPQAFRQYDAARGADRSDLYSKIDLIWQALEKIIPANFRGYYMGDLLYAGAPQNQGGFFVFKPNTVTYKVKVNSDPGKHIASSIAGIAVHTFIPGIGEGDQPLSGLGGLPTTGPIWFVSGEMPVPRVTIDSGAINGARAVINNYDDAVSSLISQLTQMKAKGVLGALSTYITSRISGGNFNNMTEGFYQYLPTRLSGGAQAKLLGANKDGWLYKEGAAGIKGMFAIWVALYNLKLNIKQQIDSQVSGDVQAFVGNTPGHEGYVVGGGDQKIKLIDRLGFSKANFAKNG